MKKAVVILATIAALMVAPVVALAQGPGEGGPIIEGNGGTSIGPINDLRCSGTDCRAVTQWLTVGTLGVDPDTQYFAPNVEGALVKDWTVSEDGLTYTFNLNNNLVWSDGEPVDGWDWLFAYYAYKNADAFESPYAYTVDDIESVEVSEDGYTVTINFTSASCGATPNPIQCPRRPPLPTGLTPSSPAPTSIPPYGWRSSSSRPSTRNAPRPGLRPCSSTAGSWRPRGSTARTWPPRVAAGTPVATARRRGSAFAAKGTRTTTGRARTSSAAAGRSRPR